MPGRRCAPSSRSARPASPGRDRRANRRAVTMAPVTPTRRAPGPQAPSPRPTLSEDDVVAAALRLTRRVGLAGMSMRALADELGVTTMAAYYHVPNKEALLDLVANAVLNGVQIPADGDWTDRLIEQN